MTSSTKALAIFICGVCLVNCNKSNDVVVSPTTIKPVISNLSFTPDIITLKPNTSNYVINGTINFENALGGVALLRLTASTGANITVPIPSNNETKGTLTGAFQVTLPGAAGIYTFEVSIVDGKGNSSNKLSGTVQAVIDDSAIKWGKTLQSYSLHRVLWANNKYIAVGPGGIIVTSPDGNNWTAQNSGATSTLFGVAWSGSQYVAVGEAKTILTSPDGVSWTTRSSGITGITLYAVAASGNQYTIVGHNTNSNQTVIITSPDGLTWTNNSTVIARGTLNSVRWAGNQFIAVGGAFGYPLVLTSTNGTDWTNRSSSITTPGELADVTYSEAKYVAVGYAVTATSTDGINWNGVMTNWGSAGIVWSGSKFVASSVAGIMTSGDGLTWTKTFDPAYPLRSIAWSGMQYVAVGFVSPIILVSPPS